MDSLPTIAIISESPKTRLDDDDIYIFMSALELEKYLNAKSTKHIKQSEHNE